MDIAIKDGKIFQVAADIPAGLASRVVDVQGMYVTPGLIDMHVHAFHGTDREPTLPTDGMRCLPTDLLSVPV